MILVTMTINGTDHYLSTEYLALDKMWKGQIFDIGSITYTMRKEYGGYVEPKFGGITLSPEVFKAAVDWIPPTTCPVIIKYTNDTEANAVEIFKGTAHLREIKIDHVVYDLYSYEYGSYVETLLSGPLNTLFTTYCGPTHLNLSIDLMYARSPSPLVYYDVTTKSPTLEALSDIAAFYSHSFNIVGNTLYLTDMFDENRELSLTKFIEPVYQMPTAYNIFKADSKTVESDFPYADKSYDVTPVCSNNSTYIDDALRDIKTLIERPTITVEKPLDVGGIPIIGSRYLWIDSTLEQDVVASVWVRSVTYDLNDEFAVIVGDGTMKRLDPLELLSGLEMLDDLVML